MNPKPLNFTWSGVTPQLFLVIVLPLSVLLLLTTFGGLRVHQLSMRHLVGERDERAARAAASALGEQVTHRMSVIHSLALQVSQETGLYNPVKINEELEYYASDFDGGLAVFDSQAGLVDFSGDGTFWKDLDLGSIRKNFKAKYEGVVVIYSNEGLPGGPVTFIMLASQGQNGFTSAGAFYPTTLVEPVISGVFDPSLGGYAFVMDKDRQLLFQIGTRPDPKEDLKYHIGVAEALDGASGSTFVDMGGDEHVVAYSPVEPVGWALVIEEPWDVVASPLLRLTEYAPLVLIPTLLLALLALWFGTSRIVQPLRQLQENASALGWGDYELIENPVGGIAEIRYLQKELAQLSKKVQMAQQSLKGYIRAMTRGLEEERRRLARELHDDTLQSLIALNQRIQLARLSEDDTTSHQGLDEIQNITENTIQDLRRTVQALRPIYLEDLGLLAALEMLASETQKIHGVIVHFECAGKEKRLPDEIELALYRMVQEALSNVRHANAANVSLSISFFETYVILQITDDGVGFEVPDSSSAFATSNHYGLLGMYERAELIDAKLNISSEPGNGTRIQIRLAVVKRVAGA